ncbi:hypothetical protein [uncultured Corynebacterium sp.]|uniref:hypothetical protein n=1 Tax=uncultured Corynebacterium sp. TaxID=159447 RepID=UPI0028D8F3A6|nr:hypothetical protein [uncultured Corynebacterium sp.]
MGRQLHDDVPHIVGVRQFGAAQIPFTPPVVASIEFPNKGFDVFRQLIHGAVDGGFHEFQAEVSPIDVWVGELLVGAGDEPQFRHR